MNEFKTGDEVVYMIKNKPTYYATVIAVDPDKNRMWVEWYDDTYIKTQLIDCDNFELVNRKSNEK